MQHALLGLAIALILAIAAALAAPAYMDWNDWRTTFEDRASALVGTPVRIHGRIDATILPTPAFVLRDVEAGDPDKATGMRVAEVRGILSLGALLRGILEAEEFVLVRPAMRLAIKDGERPLLPVAGAAAGVTGPIALARVKIDQGSLVVDDRAAGRQMIFDEIFANGEVRAGQGPVRLDATFRSDNRRWSLRTNASRFNSEGTGRVRLTVEQAGGGLSFDADGMLALAGAVPRFDGKIIAARRGADGTPWQIAASANASEAAVVLTGLELTLGANAAPTEIAGQVQFAPQRGGRIEGALSARRIDLDIAAGAEGPRQLSEALATMREVAGLVSGLPFQGRIGVSIDALIAGGGTVRGLKADVALHQGSLAVEKLEAGLPGRATVKASGGNSRGALFSGEATVDAEDAVALGRWAFGPTVRGLQEGDALQASGKVKWAQDRVEVDALDVVLGDAKFGGGFAVIPGDAIQRMRVETRLTASNVNLDLLAPVADALRSGSQNMDLVLGIQGSALRFLGRSVRRLDAKVSRTEEAVEIERLVLEDFDGLSVRAHGRIAAPIERPSGSIDFDLQATKPDGLAIVATELLGADAGLLARSIATSGRPLKLSGKALGAGSAAGVEVTASGYLADVATKVDAHFDLLTETLSEAQVVLEAQEAGKLISLFGLTPGPPTPGEGVLEVNFASAGEGVLPVMARLLLPGAKMSAEGQLRTNADGRIDPRLNLRFDALDLRPLLAVVARTSGEAAVAADGTARLVRTPEAFAFENVILNVGASRVRGTLTASGIEKPAISGKLSAERMELAHLLALALGSAPAGEAESSGSYWPAMRLEAAPLAGARGTVEWDVAELALADRLAATGAKFRFRLGANDVAIEDFTGNVAGGKFAGHARIIHGGALAFDGRASLEGFDVASLLASSEAKTDVRGKGSLTLSVAGDGRTPAALAASLSGQGTIVLEGLEIDRVAPGAVAEVFNAGEKNEPRDEIDVIATLAPALAKGTLHIAKLEAPVIVAGGVARTGKARTSSGKTQVAAEGSLDIAHLTVDAAVELEIPPPPGMTVRPGVTVRWRGPLAAPERGIEAVPLATAITLRAVERETKRIEERDRARPPLELPRSEQGATPREANPLASIPLLGGAKEPPNAQGPDAQQQPPVRSATPQARSRSAEPQPPATLPPLAPPIDIRPAPQIFAPRQ